MPITVKIVGLNFTFEYADKPEPIEILDGKGNLYELHLDQSEGIRITKKSGARQVKVTTSTPIYSRNKVVAFDDKVCGYVDEVIIK